MLSSAEGRLLGGTAADLVRVSGASAASLAIASKAARDIDLGDLEQVQILGELGSIVIARVKGDAVLTLVIDDRSQTGGALAAVRRGLPKLELLL